MQDAQPMPGTSSPPSRCGLPSTRYGRRLPSRDHSRDPVTGPDVCHQQTTEWKDRYKIRSGIEATNSELKRCHGIGKLRVRRAVRVCFAVACKVIACNIRRWAAAHLVPKEALARLLSSFWARMRTLCLDPSEISLCLRITCSRQF